MNHSIEAGSNRADASVYGVDLHSEDVGDFEGRHAFHGRKHEDFSLLLIEGFEELSHFIRCLCPMQVSVLGGMGIRIGHELEPPTGSVGTAAMLARHAAGDAIEPVADRAAWVEVRQSAVDHEENVLYGIVNRSSGQTKVVECAPYEIVILAKNHRKVGGIDPLFPRLAHSEMLAAARANRKGFFPAARSARLPVHPRGRCRRVRRSTRVAQRMRCARGKWASTTTMASKPTGRGR